MPDGRPPPLAKTCIRVARPGLLTGPETPETGAGTGRPNRTTITSASTKGRRLDKVFVLAILQSRPTSYAVASYPLPFSVVWQTARLQTFVALKLALPQRVLLVGGILGAFTVFGLNDIIAE